MSVRVAPSPEPASGKIRVRLNDYTARVFAASDRADAEVAKWPAWKRGEDGAEPGSGTGWPAATEPCLDRCLHCSEGILDSRLGGMCGDHPGACPHPESSPPCRCGHSRLDHWADLVTGAEDCGGGDDDNCDCHQYEPAAPGEG